MAEREEMTRAILDKMLSVDFPGVAELREQAHVVRILAPDPPGNHIGLEVPAIAPRAPVAYGHPVELRWPKAQSVGQYSEPTLILNVRDGRMFEILWVSFMEDPSAVTPSLAECRIFLGDGIGQGHYADGKP